MKAKITGKPDLWQLMQAVTDPKTGCTKTTRVMAIPGGVLINTCTRGASFAAEALVAIPGMGIRKNQDGKTVGLFLTP